MLYFLSQGLNDNEEMSLIDIMVCACKQEATRQGPPGRTVRKGKEKKSSLDDKKNLSAHFMQTLPSLLNKVCEIVKWYIDCVTMTLLCHFPDRGNALHWSSLNQSEALPTSG